MADKIQYSMAVQCSELLVGRLCAAAASDVSLLVTVHK